MNSIRRTGAAAAVLAASVLLAGCASSQQGTQATNHRTPQPSASQSTEAAPHNKADVAFAEGMIPHHAQAIEMAKLALDRAQSQKVKELARQIKAAQGPEIETMTGWLRSWGVPVPRPDKPGKPGEHGDKPAGHSRGHGMMSREAMDKLRKASGAEFDRMFLTMMIKHHDGAIKMAKTELAEGQYPPAQQLAKQIIQAQQAEIKTMRQLLRHG